jgi:TPR repeat protein
MGTIHEFGLFKQPFNDTLARSFYATGAQSGFPECQAALAFYYRYGIAGPRSEARAAILTATSKKSSIWSTLHSSNAAHFAIDQPESCHQSYRDLFPLATIVLSNTSVLRHFHNNGVTRLPKFDMPVDRSASVAELDEIQGESGSAASHLEIGRRFLSAIPPNFPAAITHFQEAADSGQPVGLFYIYLISLARDGANPDVPLLVRAAQAGSWDAQVEVMRLRLAGDRDSEAQTNLEAAVSKNHAAAMYIVAEELLNGEPPFRKNVERAIQLLRGARAQGHHPALFQLARLGYTHPGKMGSSCDDSVRELLLFLELSFLFDDAPRAWRAATIGDLRYARRLYERLADMGSEAAAWNAERLARETGVNGTDWFGLQIKMKLRAALGRLGEEQVGKGQIEEGMRNLREAAKTDPAAAFALAWRIRKDDPAAADRHFEWIKTRPGAPSFAVNLAIAVAVVEHLPGAARDWCRGRETENLEFVCKYLKSCRVVAVMAAEVVGLYWLLGVRVRATISEEEN